MIKIDNTEIFGWEAAIRGMRNPMNSWDKSDSIFTEHELEDWPHDVVTTFDGLGPNDLKLMRNLAKAGNDHGKFARMINVTVDITAPRFFWEQFSTYRIGVVQNSTSTMHTIHKKYFCIEDFSISNLSDDSFIYRILSELNELREKYLETNDKIYWRMMIELLPQSYNQKRTVQLNYQVLWNIYRARQNHKLDEWREFCRWIENLPYFKEIYCLEDTHA